MQNTGHEPDATFITHEPCPSCGSKDNLARYSDGHGYCFGCQHYEKGTEMEEAQSNGSLDTFPILQTTKSREQEIVLTQGEVKALSKRKITKETCNKFDYRVGTHLSLIHI